MNNTASISQYLALLGGSANPALMQNTSAQNAEAGFANFRNMLTMQFDLSKDDITSPQGATTATATPGLAKRSADLLSQIVPQAQATTTSNIWQMVGQRTIADGGNSLNSIVVQLQRQGLPAESVDTLIAALNKSDLVTIIKDPALLAQLENNTSMATQNGVKLADIIAALKDSMRANKDGIITFDLTDMNLDEFKEWKKQNFGDLAAFLSQEKTKIGANGEIIKILQGPAFLHDEDTSAGDSMVVFEITHPDQPLTPLQFAVQLAADPVQNAALSSAAHSFVPVPLNNLGNVTPELAAALQNASANTGKGDGQILPAIGGTALQNPAMNNGGGANAPTQSVAAKAQNNSMLTPFMTPADMNALSIGSDNMANYDVMIPFEAGFKTASQAANPLLQQPSSVHPHPTSQMVAISLTKMATGKGAEADTKAYRLQLDPPEMGRVDIDLEFEAGHKIRATIIAEKPETLGLLQRDSHVLLKALQDAGFEGASQDSLNFNLAQGQNDPAGHGGSNADDRKNGQNALLSPDGESELQILETEMSLVIDPITGQQHINMVV